MTTPMSNLTTLRLVTARELRTRGTSRAYLISAGVLLLILTGLIVLPQVLSSQEVSVDVGALGEGSEPVLALAEDIVAGDVGDRGLDFSVTTFADEEAARTALSAGEVELVVVDGEEILRQGSAGFSGSDVQDAVQEAAAVLVLEDELEGSTTDVEQVAGLLDSAPLTVRTVQGVADAEEDQARSLIAYGGMMLLYLAILIYGAWTLQGVTQEKSSRVVEVLLATVKPWQLMAGKIIGLGLLGLAQFALTIGWALLLIRVTDALTLPAIPVDSAITLTVWFVLGFLLYSTLFAIAGALSGNMEDAQTVSFPVSMIAIVGFLVSFQALDDPTGALAQVTTYVPFMAPFVVPIRVAYQEISLLEQVLAAVTTMAVTAGLVWVAARIYAGGALHFVGRLGLRRAWRSAEIR